MRQLLKIAFTFTFAFAFMAGTTSAQSLPGLGTPEEEGGNFAEINQTVNSNNSEADILQQAGATRALIEQTANQNDADIRQRGPDGGDARVVQRGFKNEALTVQTGAQGPSSVLQFQAGDFNDAVARQGFARNGKIVQKQWGDANDSTVDQDPNQTLARVIQGGDNNLGNISQGSNARGSTAIIDQAGLSNDAVIKQIP